MATKAELEAIVEELKAAQPATETKPKERVVKLPPHVVCKATQMSIGVDPIYQKYVSCLRTDKDGALVPAKKDSSKLARPYGRMTPEQWAEVFAHQAEIEASCAAVEAARA